MSTLVTRSGKGSPLTHNEVDTNFTNLNTDKVEKTSADITGGTINNTTIGATTPSTGVFTTLTATGQTSLGGVAGSESLRVLTAGASPNAYATVQGSSFSTAYFGFGGSATNGNLYFQSKNAGTITFQTNNGAQTQVNFTHTASAVNYHQLTGSATGSGPIHSVAGSDTNIDLNLTPKGTGTVVANGPFTATGQTSLGGVAGSDVFRVLKDNTFAGTTVSSFTAPQFSFIPPQSSFGAAVIGLGLNPRINSFGSDGQYFSTNQAAGFAGTLQVKIAHTASAVNYVQVTGAPTGSSPVISAQGSDSNIQIQLQAKGTGLVRFTTGGGLQAYVSDTVSAVNQLNFTGAVTGFGPRISAQGSDTNIPLVLQPKGTGALQAQQTDSTATGGNARGANAVDWQTSRTTAAQVANGQYATTSGGYKNTASGFSSTVSGGEGNSANGYVATISGGSTNTSSGSYAVIAGGYLNTISKDWSFLGAGYGNTAGGFHNFIGSGYSNSGTSASAVTTQSATMNGTTAVTLSGSNASIKVGQLITGTSITNFPNTYVAAISGTSLTLSQAASGSSTSTLSFYTPHGVVVGGGNNQATGSYSFIGGGGDAGTAANRNVASGDWSTVGGGRKNVASGIGSVVAGGGTDGTYIFSNTASGTLSTISGGWNHNAGVLASVVGGQSNNASGYCSTVVGSDCVANGSYSTVIGGVFGFARGIEGNIVFVSSVPITSGAGRSQTALLVLGAQTTDATATVLRSNTSAAGSTNQVIMPNNSAYFFTGEVVAGVTGGGNTKGWTIEGVIKRGANAASTALVGTPTVTSTYADAGASTWVIAVTADTTNGGLAVTFTGQAATTIRTVAQIRTTEMTY